MHASPDLPGTQLPRSFYARPAVTVAPELLGKLLVVPSDRIVVRLLEVEAYTEDDPACHGFGGRTPRNEVLFGPPGHAYLYFTYGMHWCANIVTGTHGTAAGVLLRAAELVEGEEVVRQRRGPKVADRDLLRGPARLAEGLGLGRDDNGVDLVGGTPTFTLLDDGWQPETVAVGPRVGVREAADRQWRFWVEGHPLVSTYVRHPKA